MTTPGYPAQQPGPQPAQGYQPHPGPTSAPAEVRAETAQATHPGLVQPAAPGRGTLTVFAIIGIVIAGVAVLAAAAYLLLVLGAAAFVGFFLALVPLGIVLLGIWWIDRWEPEPWPARIFALLWGAGVAVVVALVVGLSIEVVLSNSGVAADPTAAEFFSAVIQAPIVEESAKGFGVLLIFLVARRLFDGPVDGIVYAATVAGGFAFTENILYFGRDIVDTGLSGQVLFTFFLRGIMSPFAHVMFTSMTGLAIGIASTRWGRGAGILAYFIGLIPAMFLHGLWNGASFFVSGLGTYFAYYAIVQVPLFAGMVGLVVYLRRQESKRTVARLGEYAAAGWFNPSEVMALGTVAGRRNARVWAAQSGRGAIMKRYIREATKLAATRQRIVSGQGRAQAQADERDLLAAVTASRRALTAPAAPPPGQYPVAG